MILQLILLLTVIFVLAIIFVQPLYSQSCELNVYDLQPSSHTGPIHIQNNSNEDIFYTSIPDTEFRPIQVSLETNAPQRIDRRTASPATDARR